MRYDQLTGKMSSKDYLKYALFALMEEKNIFRITVKELCDKARVNRSTFYANYTGLDVFFREVMAETARGLVDAVESGPPQKLLSDKNVAYCRYTKWFLYVHDHANEFRLLMGPNGTTMFRDVLLKQGINWYSQLLTSVMPRFENLASLDVIAHYIVHAHLGLLEYYLTQGAKYSTEYMAQQMVNITFVGPYSLLGL